MGQIVLLHGIPLGAELVQRGLHVDSVPDNDRIGHEVETHRLVGLGFLLFPADHPLVGRKEKIAQRMQGFAFIQLGIDASAIRGVFQVAQDKEGLNQPAIFLEGPREDVRSEEHTSELQSQSNLVCRLLLEKKKKQKSSEDTLA